MRFDESGPRELSDIAARFNQMADALAQQRTTQMTHLAGVAHDLRNPVWALQLALQAARETDAGDLARQRRSLDLAERQVGRLGRMIDDLLDASSIEAGHLELRCGLHDIGAIVREIGDQFAGTSKHHRVDCRAPEQPIPAVVDPLRIGQVVTNLVSNAIKYSPEGGAVEIEIRPDGDTVVIEVADHGLGIAANEIAEVFEPFRRLPHGKRRASGMGLGLFVVRRIVEAHGGEITVTSVSGHGSRFRVRLPLVSPQITADDAFITPSENASEQRPAHAGR